MVEAGRFLELGRLLHGHKCPAMPLGLVAVQQQAAVR